MRVKGGKMKLILFRGLCFIWGIVVLLGISFLLAHFCKITLTEVLLCWGIAGVVILGLIVVAFVAMWLWEKGGE